MRAYPRLRANSNTRAWVLTIAHRKALDSHRARQRRPLPVAEPPGARPPNGAAEPDAELWSEVRRLPGKQRAAVALRYAGRSVTRRDRTGARAARKRRRGATYTRV